MLGWWSPLCQIGTLKFSCLKVTLLYIKFGSRSWLTKKKKNHLQNANDIKDRFYSNLLGDMELLTVLPYCFYGWLGIFIRLNSKTVQILGDWRKDTIQGSSANYRDNCAQPFLKAVYKKISESFGEKVQGGSTVNVFLGIS